MENFDEFWEKNKEEYIAHAKTIALADFNELSKFRAGKLVADIDIDSDDDFYFEKGLNYRVYGNTKKEIRENCIEFISNLKITHGSQSKWDWLKEEIIAKLKKGENNFSFGGNQTIDFSITENAPRVKVKL